jgi:PqqD family protein of HPr-rel-A system
VDKLADLAISDSGFVFDPYSGATFSTNGTGLAILRLLREGASRTGIVKSLEEAFDLRSEADLHRDVDEFVALMRRYELLPNDFELED